MRGCFRCLTVSHEIQTESNQDELTRKERFRIPFRRPTFHAPQPRQSEKCLGIEPLLGALATKMRYSADSILRLSAAAEIGT